MAVLAKLKNAQRSHKMLKQKSEGLEIRRRGVAQQIINMKEKMGELMTEAYFSLTEAKYICGDFSSFVLNTASEACCHVQSITENVGGAILRSSELIVTEELDQFKNIGLSQTSYHLKNAKEKFRAVLKLLVKLASLEMSFQNLEIAVKVTNSRVNGIAHVIIPHMEETVGKIVMEMDEMEREEFFRLKKVQKMKQVAEQRRQEEKTSTFQMLSEIRTSSLLSLSPAYSRTMWKKKQRKKGTPVLVADTPMKRKSLSPHLHNEMLQGPRPEDEEEEEEELLEEDEKDQGSYDSITSLEGHPGMRDSLFTFETMKEDDSLSTDGMVIRFTPQSLHSGIREKADPELMNTISPISIHKDEKKSLSMDQVLTFGPERLLESQFLPEIKPQRSVTFEDEKLLEDKNLQNEEKMAADDMEEEQEIATTDINWYPKSELLEEKSVNFDTDEKVPVSSDFFRFQVLETDTTYEDVPNDEKTLVIDILRGLISSIEFHRGEAFARDSFFPTKDDKKLETIDIDENQKSKESISSELVASSGTATEEQKSVKSVVFQDNVVDQSTFDQKSTGSNTIEDQKSLDSGTSEVLTADNFPESELKLLRSFSEKGQQSMKDSTLPIFTTEIMREDELETSDIVKDQKLMENIIIDSLRIPAEYDKELETSDIDEDQKSMQTIFREYQKSVASSGTVTEDQSSVNNTVFPGNVVFEDEFDQKSMYSDIIKDQKSLASGTSEEVHIEDAHLVPDQKLSTSSDVRGLKPSEKFIPEVKKSLIDSGVSMEEPISGEVVEDIKGIHSITSTAEEQMLVSNEILEKQKSIPSHIPDSQVLVEGVFLKPEYNESDRQIVDKTGDIEEYKSAIGEKSMIENIHKEVPESTGSEILEEFKPTSGVIKQKSHTIEYQTPDFLLPRLTGQKFEVPESDRGYVREHDEEVYLGEFLFDTEAGLIPEEDEVLAMRDFLAGKHTIPIVTVKNSSDTIPISSSPPSLFGMMWEKKIAYTQGKEDKIMPLYDRQQLNEVERELKATTASQKAQFDVKKLKQSIQSEIKPTQEIKSEFQSSKRVLQPDTLIPEDSDIPNIIRTSSRTKYKVDGRGVSHVRFEMPMESNTDSDDEIQKILFELDKNPLKVEEDKQSDPLCSVLGVQEESAPRKEKKKNPKTLWDTLFNE